MELEEWKNIEGYEGVYQVSNFGEIKNIKTNRILKAGINSDGYYCVVLRKNNNQKSFKVHRLVAQAFICNPENKKQVNHKNGVKTDNRAINLEWNTCKENINHAWKNNLAKGKYKGYGNRATKIAQLDNDNNVLAIYMSTRLASEMNKISETAINNCLRGIAETSGGFKWRYIVNE